MIEKTAFKGYPHAEIEMLFSHLELIAPALAAAGILILFAGLQERRRTNPQGQGDELTTKQATAIGLVQGLCLPFRGFSRSGATISTGMLAGASRERSETFSFALAVVLTPAVIGREALRLIKAEHISTGAGLGAAVFPAILGAVFSFLAGLFALKWLSSWLEAGRWYLFGIYCLVAAAVVEGLHLAGY